MNKCVAIALWRMGTGNSYRTTGITFGQGKSTVIKICENFMEALICHKELELELYFYLDTVNLSDKIIILLQSIITVTIYFNLYKHDLKFKSKIEKK